MDTQPPCSCLRTKGMTAYVIRFHGCVGILITSNCVCLLCTSFRERLLYTVQQVCADSKKVDIDICNLSIHIHMPSNVKMYVYTLFYFEPAYMVLHSALQCQKTQHYNNSQQAEIVKTAIMVLHSALQCQKTQHYNNSQQAEIVKTAINTCRSHRGAPVAAV